MNSATATTIQLVEGPCTEPPLAPRHPPLPVLYCTRGITTCWQVVTGCRGAHLELFRLVDRLLFLPLDLTPSSGRRPVQNSNFGFVSSTWEHRQPPMCQGQQPAKSPRFKCDFEGHSFLETCGGDKLVHLPPGYLNDNMILSLTTWKGDHGVILNCRPFLARAIILFLQLLLTSLLRCQWIDLVLLFSTW